MSDKETLRYQVPEWQDPVVVVTALTNADYEAVPETGGGNMFVTITCPEGRERDRERVREVIAREADQSSLEGPRFDPRVTFDDEA